MLHMAGSRRVQFDPFWLCAEMRDDPDPQPYDRMPPLQSRFVRRVVQGEHEFVTDPLFDESIFMVFQTDDVWLFYGYSLTKACV
jgi:hypothetical protein